MECIKVLNLDFAPIDKVETNNTEPNGIRSRWASTGKDTTKCCLTMASGDHLGGLTVFLVVSLMEPVEYDKVAVVLKVEETITVFSV